MKIRSIVPILGIVFAGVCTSFAQTLFSDDFDSDHTSSWSVKKGSTNTVFDSFADFYFDYGVNMGIPSAPNSVGGTTRGLRFLCNQSAGTAQGISAFPVSQGFTGNYRLRFDMWLNYNGPLGPTSVGGSGSTQHGSFGVGATGTAPQWYFAAANSVMFALSGDGGAVDDYRCYSNSVHLAATSGAYPANSRDSGVAYYTNAFPGYLSAPTNQAALFPGQTGTTPPGSLGFKWRDVIVQKIGNTVTCTVDGKLMATSGTPAAFSTNIFLGLFDAFVGSSTDPNDFLICAIYDNVRVEQVPDVVSVTTSIPEAKEDGTATGQFTFTRTGDGSAPMTINYTLSGTASNGVDYISLPGSITMNVGQTNVTLDVQAIDDSITEFAETVVLTIASSTNYFIQTSSATVTISDNETPELSISVLQPTAYERTLNDYMTFQVTRKGDLSTDLFANIAFTGTAVYGVNFSGPSSVYMPAGTNNQTFKLSPINDTELATSNLTIIASLDAGGGYTIGTNSSATGTIIDDELSPETNVLFSDDLTTDTSANWTTRFGANNLLDDKAVVFAFDPDNNDPWGSGIPPGPNGVPRFLKMTVNKDTNAAAAGVNVYPTGQSFSGDYAVRFDMYLQQNNNTGTTEFATFGINHSGTKTNWNRQSAALAANTAGIPKDTDGLWFSVSSDASGSQPGDYALLTSTNATVGATVLKTAAATSFAGVFKKEPFSPAGPGGSPANVYGATDKLWVNVEIKKIGALVTLSINKTPIITYTNTTTYTSGNIMLGYMDPYDSIGLTGGSVYYSNLRVVDLGTANIQRPTISGVQMINGGTKVQIDFTGAATDSGAYFTVQSAANLSDSRSSYKSEAGAVITTVSPGVFRAVVPVTTGTRFYFINR